MLRALAHEYDFTVFSVQFENPCPDRIKWVRIPVPLRPLALLFVTYHLIAPIVYFLHWLKTGVRFDLIQMVESNLGFGAVTYSQFCHTSFLKRCWRQTEASGLRGFLRWLDHRLHALTERRVYSSAKRVVVPSRGLARELEAEFPKLAGKIEILPNAVDVDGLPRPAEFDRDGFRRSLGISSGDVVFVFAALGHFERKGLPIILEALAQSRLNVAKLLVVGGTNDLIKIYRARVKNLGLSDAVIFLGMQSDVRPCFWAADAYVLASNYETFSLATFEAAAASLPVITPPLHGVEEIVTDGQTGYIVKRTPKDFAAAMDRFVRLNPVRRADMGRQARSVAMEYNEERFVANWRCFYRTIRRYRSLSGMSEPIVRPTARVS
ncbi:MAG: glycosyltransferase family 4 protein [Acidobacteriaceae bacterium]|nr:glycosyltransferase family 4 protein [Acidobacteriaceae bacterium]